MGSIRILLVDDHPIVRDGLRLLLEHAPGLTVAGEAGDGPTALRLAAALCPDVLILDMALPGLSGVEVARRLQADHSPVKILALSAHDDEVYIRGVLDAGVAGYLLKDEARQVIVGAVRGVACGETGWLSRRVMAQALQRERTRRAPAAAGLDVLSPRERQVLRRLAQGQTDAQIAAALYITAGTVHNHVTSIYGKLGLHKRGEVIAWSWRQGHIEDSHGASD